MRRLRRTPALRRLVAEARLSRRRPRRAAVREGGHRRARAGRVDARRRAAHPGEPPQGGARARRPRRPGGDPLRRPRHQGRRAAPAPTRPTAWCRSRCATCATRSATRSCSWPTTASTSTPTTATAACSPPPARSTTTPRSSATRRSRSRRPTRAPTSSRRRGMMDGQVGAIRAALDAVGPRRHRDPRLRGEVRVGALRTVPRRGRVRAAVRRPARLPDGSAPTRARRSTRPRSTSPRAPTW